MLAAADPSVHPYYYTRLGRLSLLFFAVSAKPTVVAKREREGGFGPIRCPYAYISLWEFGVLRGLYNGCQVSKRPRSVYQPKVRARDLEAKVVDFAEAHTWRL